MYKNIAKIRMFEERVAELFAEGKIPGFVHLYIGEEAVANGVCANLRDTDYITSTHRGHGHLISKGGDLKLMMAELFGKKTGYCKGKGGSMHIADLDLGILGANGNVGGGPPIAAGAAMARQYKGTDNVCVWLSGDGASNQGTTHAAMNLASVWGEFTSQARHQVVAVHDRPGDAVSGRPFGYRFDALVSGLGGELAVLVVFHNAHDRRLPDGCQVHRLVGRALVGGTVTREADTHVVRPLVLP